MKEKLTFLDFVRYITIVAFCLWLFNGCNIQKNSKINSKQNTDTSIIQNEQNEKNTDKTTTSQSISAGNVDLQIDENEINIKFSPPDSAGIQYPTELTIKGKKINLTSTKSTEKSEQTAEKSAETQKKDTNINAKTNDETDIKTVQKTKTQSLWVWIICIVLGVIAGIFIKIYFGKILFFIKKIFGKS